MAAHHDHQHKVENHIGHASFTTWVDDAPGAEEAKKVHEALGGALHEYYEKSFAACMPELRENAEVEALHKAGLIEDSEHVQLVTSSFKESIWGKMQHEVARVWDEFDNDGNGVLDMEENQKLTHECLKVFRPGDLVDWHFETTVAVAIRLAETRCAKGGISWDVDNNDIIRDAILEEKDAFAATFEQVWDDLIANSHVVATALYKKMDLNSDNEVSKEEFCATFADAVDSIVGGGAMVQHMERWAAR